MGAMTLSDIERIGAGQAEHALQMTEDEFRGFYELTSRPLWAYVARMTGDDRLADDLLQESYYRFLRSRVSFADDDHRRHYLFRVATNLIHDHRRRSRAGVADADDLVAAVDADDPHTDARAVKRLDLTRALRRLKPRERTLLWLAYAQGWSHAEIAESLGLKTTSLKALLFRARQRLVQMLGDTRPRS